MLSYWERESFLTYDFVIVGAGIVGLSTAAALLERQPAARVLVLERGLLPTGASTRNAGFVTAGSLSEIIADSQRCGLETAIANVKRRMDGLARLRTRVGDRAIDYEATGNYELLFARDEAVYAQLETVNRQLKNSLPAPFFIDTTKRISEYGFDKNIVQQLIHCPHVGLLDTGKLMRTLFAYVMHKGGNVLTGAEVRGLQEVHGSVSIEVVNPTGAEAIHFAAEQVAVCTNAFAAQLLPAMMVTPGRGQVLVTRPLAHLPFRGGFHFDCGFFYFRSLGSRILFGGGRNLAFESEATTDFACTDLIQNALIDRLRTIIIPDTEFEIDYSWAGIMAFTDTGSPILERVSPRICAGVALGGIGVALGSYVGDQLGAMLLDG